MKFFWNFTPRCQNLFAPARFPGCFGNAKFLRHFSAQHEKVVRQPVQKTYYRLLHLFLFLQSYNLAFGTPANTTCDVPH